MNIQQFSIHAQQSQAAYASLSAGLTGSPLAQALSSQSNSVFTATQARTFAAAHTVVAQYNDDAPGAGGQGTSLSVTVFRDATGQVSLAIRGTAETADLLVADADIAVSGAAYNRSAALYSWWLSASTSVGSVVPAAAQQTRSVSWVGDECRTHAPSIHRARRVCLSARPPRAGAAAPVR
jgi:hypothetical protein